MYLVRFQVPYNHLAAHPAQEKNCEEYEEVDEAISKYDTRASLNMK